MKPIRLEISAFGPYAGVTQVDFTNMSSDSLFLARKYTKQHTAVANRKREPTITVCFTVSLKLI